MDREYLVNQLMEIAKQNGVEIDAEVLGMIVNKSVFRVVAKGGILQNVGEETKTAALVLNGICRAYYVDGDGNDITRGFSTLIESKYFDIFIIKLICDIFKFQCPHNFSSPSHGL